MGPMEEIYEDILKLMDEITALGMELQKLTAGQTEKNRTWDMEMFFPQAIPEMKEYIRRIRKYTAALRRLRGKSPPSPLH